MKSKINIWIYPLLVMGLSVILINSCKKENKEQVPTLTTTVVNNISSTTATCGGLLQMVVAQQ